MAQHKHGSTLANLAEVKALLGEAPILSTESRNRFERVFDLVTAALKPKDFLECQLTREYTYNSWLIERFTRHQAIAIEQRVKLNRAQQAERKQTVEAKKQKAAEFRAEMAQTKPAEIASLIQREEAIAGMIGETDETLRITDEEFECNRALQQTIDFIEQLDVLIARATTRRNDALKLIEMYRAGLGWQIRDVVDEIVISAANETGQPQIAAPSIIPTEDENNEHGAENKSEPAQRLKE